jgi:hypothetical protein
MTQRMAQRLTTAATHFDRAPAGGAADAARLHFDCGLDVVERLRKQHGGIADPACRSSRRCVSSAP